MRRFALGLAAMVWLLGTSVPASHAQVRYRTIASDDYLLSFPLLNDRGDVAYLAGRPATVGGKDLWVYRDGGNQHLASVGETAPGVSLPGATFFGLSRPFLSQGGQVAFHGRFMHDGGEIVDAIWAESPGGLSLVAMGGMAVPGYGGMTFYDVAGPVVMDASGNVAFSGRFRVDTGTGFYDRYGYFTCDAATGGLAPLIVAAPPPGMTEYSVNLLTGLMARDNGFVLAASATQDYTVRNAIWTSTQNAAALLASTPLVTDRGTSSWLLRMPFANRSETILAETSDAWVEFGPDGIRTVVALNDPLPTQVQLAFKRMQDFPVMNPAGQAAFAAKGVPQNSSFEVGGVWYEDEAGQLTTLALEGRQCAGFADGTLFSGVFSDVAISDTGQVAFLARLPNADALFATDRLGNLHLVASEGAELPGSGVISHLHFGHDSGLIGDWSNLALAFNADRNLVFRAEFFGGPDRIIMAEIPEPATASLLVIGAPALLAGRRRTAKAGRA